MIGRHLPLHGRTIELHCYFTPTFWIAEALLQQPKEHIWIAEALLQQSKTRRLGG